MTEAQDMYYRLHRVGLPEFAAEHAWSGLWGQEFSADGSQSQCLTCDGTGEVAGETCTDCDGDGWQDCQRGYSACDTAADLIAYFAQHGEPCDDDEVITFEGQYVGAGFDGESLVIPTRVISRTAWSEFVEAHREAR